MTEIKFGKYKGKTYEQALTASKNYCKWIGSQLTESEDVRDFQKWLLEKGVIEELNTRIFNNGEKIIGK